MKTFHLKYFSYLEDLLKTREETVKSSAKTARDLLIEIETKHNIKLEPSAFRIAINDEFSDYEALLCDQDIVVLIPPVSGG
jgi:sulfur-carrier protein